MRLCSSLGHCVCVYFYVVCCHISVKSLTNFWLFQLWLSGVSIYFYCCVFVVVGVVLGSKVEFFRIPKLCWTTTFSRIVFNCFISFLHFEFQFSCSSVKLSGTCWYFKRHVRKWELCGRRHSPYILSQSVTYLFVHQSRAPELSVLSPWRSCIILNDRQDRTKCDSVIKSFPLCKLKTRHDKNKRHTLFT